METPLDPAQGRLPVDKAADAYGIPRDRLSRAVSAGEVEGFQIGRARLVDRRSLEAWIDSHKITPKAKKAGADG